MVTTTWQDLALLPAVPGHFERQLSGLRCFWPGPEDARRVVGCSSFFSSCTVQYPPHVLACSFDFQPTDIACGKKNWYAPKRKKNLLRPGCLQTPSRYSKRGLACQWSGGLRRASADLCSNDVDFDGCCLLLLSAQSLSVSAPTSDSSSISPLILPPAIPPSQLSQFPYLPSVQLLSHSCEVAQTSVDQR